MSGQEVGLSRRLVGACAGLVISLLAVPLDGQEHAQGAQPREGNPPRVVRDLTGNLSPAEELAAVERALASAPNEELGLRLRDKHFGLSMLDGELLGFALSWKAHFLDRAVRFTPALGQAVETTQSLELELASIRVGDAPLYEKGAAASERTHAEKRVRYAVQPGLTEVWEASPDGLELSYVFDTLPTRGELVVSLDLATDMVPVETERTAGPLVFRAGEVDALRIGEVWGIDAAGRRAQGWLHTDGTSLELGLPAAFVEEAELPLVLDPLISGLVSTLNALDLGAPDIAFNFSTQSYCSAFEIEISASDRDVHAAVFTVSPLTFAQGFIVSGLVEDDEIYPAVAGGSGAFGQFGFRVAYEVESAGSSSVRTRSIAGSLGVMSVGSETIAISGAGRPDICSVNEVSSHIVAAESDGTVDPAGIVMVGLSAGIPDPVEQVSTNSASRLDERPRFSQPILTFNPTGGIELVVVWDRLFIDDPNPGDTDFDVAARAYQYGSGGGSFFQPLSSETLIATNIGTHEYRAALGGPAPFFGESVPDLSDDKLIWTFVYQFEQLVTPFEKGIYAKTFGLPPSGLATDPLEVTEDIAVLIEDDVGQDEEWPAIAAVATSGAYPQSYRPFGQYLVSWTEDDVGGNPAVFARGITLYLAAPCEDEFLVGPTAGVSSGAVGRSAIASNAWDIVESSPPEAMIVFGALDPATGPDFIAGYNAANGDLGSIETFPTGCPESIGIHSYVGCAAPGRTVYALLDDSDPSFDLAIGLVSLNRLDPAIPCGCGELVVDVFGTTFWAFPGDPSDPGAFGFFLSVIDDPSVVGLKYYAQFAVGTTGPPVSSCSLGFDFTTAFAVTIGAGN